MTVVRVVGPDGRTVCERCEIASTPLTRLRGLLGRRALDSGTGMLVRPAPSVHTWFMRFAIDAVFLDRDHVIVGLRRDVPPWRFAGARGARMTLELAAGEAKRRNLAVGERLALVAPHRSTEWQAAAGRRPISVLLATVDGAFAAVASFLLDRAGFAVARTSGECDFVDEVAREQPDVVVVDAGIAGASAGPFLSDLVRRHPEVGVVVVDDATAPRLVGSLPKWGAFDVLRERIERVA